MSQILQILQETSTPREVGKQIVIAVLLARLQLSSTKQIGPAKSGKENWKWNFVVAGGYYSLFLFAGSWLALVNYFVPDPYLDEVFHIPQAQMYCEGRYLEWDDKITTPPGLYVLSLLYHKLWMLTTCTASSLRGFNVIVTLQVALLAALCRDLIEKGVAARRRTEAQSSSFYAYHTAINIALFPVLFFFSSLYYTDVLSTLAVLVAYRHHLSRISAPFNSLASDLCTVLLGIGSLLMRQTNVFWVVVYMGGLEAVSALRGLEPERVDKPRLETVVDVTRFYLWRYSVGEVHDPPLHLAWPDDCVISCFSFAVAAVCNPLRVLQRVWPYITVMGLFCVFLVWNGGVVLGDKSNHVATIHVSQMQYIWPFFAFFSAPLLLPAFLSAARSVLDAVKGATGVSKASPTTGKGRSEPSSPSILSLLQSFLGHKYYYLPYLAGTIVLSLVTVRLNTIIHPFTLADNRHYMFYIFRYTILQPGLTRYFLTLAYFVSRLVVWGRLAGCSRPVCGQTVSEYINSPFWPQSAPSPQHLSDGGTKGRPSQSARTGPTPADVLGHLDEPTSTSATPPATSTALFWLLATSLSLVTAPLVEPRYFILPWVFWRLLVPAWPAQDYGFALPRGQTGAARFPVVRGLIAFGSKVDVTLALETVWFVTINLGTMYMFLFRPYVWRSAEGDVLDGGRLQRFMW